MTLKSQRHPDDIRLADLSAGWCDHALSACEQESYFVLLTRLLRSFPLTGGFASLRGERDELVDDFIEAKTLVKEVRFKHVTALHGMFANFLKDRLKSYDHRNVLREADFHLDGETTSFDHLVSALAESPDVADANADLPYEALLASVFADHGLTTSTVIDAAAEQFQSWPDWARALLTHHFCARGKAMPLGVLSKRFGVASYSYRVAQLGVSFGNLEELDATQFAQTLFGRWITSLLQRPLCAGDGRFMTCAFDMLTLVVQTQVPAARKAAPMAGGPKP